MNNMDLKSTLEPLKSQIGGGISERNVGIDALRLLSMFYIVILHILGHGGVLNNTVGVANDLVWLLEIIAYCAVDIYALISGYAGYAEEKKPFRSSKYISMWLQVFCYSFGITMIAFLLKPQSIGLKTLVKSIFPVATNQYWYFSSFTAVFLLKPWINSFVRKISKKELTVFSLLAFGLFSCYSVFASRLVGDPFNLSSGFSALWLLILYIVGAWLKKCNIGDITSNKQMMIIIIGCNLIMWVGRQFLPSVIGADILISYVSPTVFLSAMAYVILFLKAKPVKTISKLITFLAPAAFGVYLIHDNNLIRAHFVSRQFGWIYDFVAWKLLVSVIGSALLFFVVCILIERLRLFLFKLLKVDVVTKHVGNMVDGLLLGVANKFAHWMQSDC